MSEKYKEIAKEARKKTLELIYKAGTSHIGSCLSVVDILAVLFEKVDIEKDEVILSAGWKAAIWYYFLWKKGIITEDELNSFCQPRSKFIGLVEPMGRWGLRFAGGSMGYGLPFGVGVALAKKLKKEEGRVYVIMSDGELQCGTTWEASMIAGKYNLDNLVVLIDNNGFQAMGEVNDILSIPWDNFEAWYDIWYYDGHDYKDIEYGLGKSQGEPKMMVCTTTKGKGVSFMENNNLYHYKAPSREEYEEALKELNN